MSSMVLLSIIVVLVSGLIAYIGDLVGRKMGRKRLTLFGLRPRYTAIIISVVSGMVIAALTLTATFAVDKGVRDLLLTPLAAIKADLAAKGEAVRQTQRELDAAQREKAEAALHLARKSDELTALNRKMTDSNQRLRQLLAQRRRITAELARAAAALDREQSKLRAVQRSLTESQRQLHAVRRDLTAARDGLDRSKAMLIDLVKKKRNLENRKLALEQQLVELGDQVTILSPLAAGSFALLAFASRQELLTGIFPTTGSAAERKAMLARFLAAANDVTRRQCPQLPKEAAPLIFLGGTDAHPVRITEQQAIETLSNRIAGVTATTDAILRLAPVNNVPVNGQALIAVNLSELISPNYRTYLADNEVARVAVTVGERTTTAEVLEHLVNDLLRDRLPVALRSKEMLLVTRRFDAGHPDAVPEPAWSMVSWSDLLGAAEKARTFRGPVQVIARARAAATRFGPLHLYLDVTPGAE